ncbi:MFS general substrate transporter [Schizophyllum commune H4-8]|uniref:MFS general substrate transporter n=1 Tax=Schizophyllum commune (strain H4-8 / FGSC 9210) TaxID=578458 RepID=UPI00215EC6C6|nr:MFS general substrate transporter [Schizophyllum commune H4-8]KAI5894059.1 MFS general substrate transporter [Schizophyllum commune H4-8]
MTVAPDSYTDESRPLLDQRPPSYHSASDVDSEATLDGDDASSPPLINAKSKSEIVWILAGLWSAVFLGALDGTIVATLLTPIGSQFNRSNQSSYIGTSYLLSVCCFTPLYGRLSDILGRKGAMLLALTLFGVGTACCGIAPSMNTLLAARAVAGMGGGGVMTVSSVTVTDLIPLKQRGLYQGMANILFGMGAGLGGPLGGWINDNLGWRAAFLLQIPILIFSFVLVAWKVNIVLPSEVQSLPLKEKLLRIDFGGSITLVIMVGSLLLGFSLKTTEEMPWSSPLIVGLFVTSAVFAVAFLAVEKYWAHSPVMPLRLLKQRTALAVSLNNLVSSMAAFSMLYNVPLYFSAVRLQSAASAGLHLLPHSVALSTGSVFAGWVMRKTGKLYTLTLVSSLLTVLANVLVVLWTDKTSAFHLWFDIVPQGFGMASSITSTLIAMIAGVYKEDMAVATGITYLFRTTGQVLGVSLSGAILQAVLLSQLRHRITGPNAAEIIYEIRHSIATIRDLDPLTKEAAVRSYGDALRVVFVFQLVMCIIAFLSCVPIQENALPGTHEEQEQHYRNQREQEERDGHDA